MSGLNAIGRLERERPRATRERARIVQIIPGTGWVGRFRDGEGEASADLVGWALMEYVDDRSGEERFVVGLIADGQRLRRADAVETFLRYEYVGERVG
ncbi:MAG TPA: hypothetical protein VF406_16105 [Thermodesulfobacteriota bacterium]